MDEKKILILFPGFKLFGQEQGLLAVATAMRQKGIDCHFLVHKKWGKDISYHLRSLNFEYTSLRYLGVSISNPSLSNTYEFLFGIEIFNCLLTKDDPVVIFNEFKRGMIDTGIKLMY